jgi:hypothetical protein
MSNFLNDYNPLVCTDAEIALLRDQEIWKTKKKLTTKIDNLLDRLRPKRVIVMQTVLKTFRA